MVNICLALKDATLLFFLNCLYHFAFSPARFESLFFISLSFVSVVSLFNFNHFNAHGMVFDFGFQLHFPGN